jgi:alkylglycerol monooxygenase
MIGAMDQELLSNRIILIGIPAMLLVVLLERLLAGLRSRDLGPWDESISNIQCGLGQLVLELPIKGLLVFPYLYLYQHYGFWRFSPSAGIFIASFVLTDFLHYWYHRTHHEIPWLWKIHAVHHQPKHFNYTVGLRLPWLHKLTVFPFYFAQALLGIPVEIFLVTVSLHAILQLWTHTELIEGKWGFLNYLLVTPSHHRVHHGMNERYLDRNYAAAFSVWDWLFGTFTPETEKVQYGIKQGIDPRDVLASNLAPFLSKPPAYTEGLYLVDEFDKGVAQAASLILGVYTLYLGSTTEAMSLLPLIIYAVWLYSHRLIHLKLLLLPLILGIYTSMPLAYALTTLGLYFIMRLLINDRPGFKQHLN